MVRNPMSTVKRERWLFVDGEPVLVAADILFFEAYGVEIKTAKEVPDALSEYSACTRR